MDNLLEFAKGPLFRFSFALMLLGLARVFYISLLNGFEARKKGKDKVIPSSFVTKMTLGFTFPIRAFRRKPIYATISILFHVGLLITPILLFDHSLLFQNAVGISLLSVSLPKQIADLMTLATIITGVVILIFRMSSRESRFLSRVQDYLWPILLLIPFATGIIAATSKLSPDTYDFVMLTHILGGNLIFILIPMTKIAHCVLIPLSQWVTARAWKFEAEGGEAMAKAFNKQGVDL